MDAEAAAEQAAPAGGAIMFGPYHRLKSPTQTNDVAEMQQLVQEVWGRPRRDSDIPQVQAYEGELPNDAEGIEFVTATEPDSNTPPGHVRWTGPRGGVRVEDGFAKVPVQITFNTQIKSAPATAVMEAVAQQVSAAASGSGSTAVANSHV